MPIRFKMTWRTRQDAQVCPVCKALEGYTWTLEVGDPQPEQLLHPIYGPVYDMRLAAACSTVKEKGGHVCRCSLKYGFDVSNQAPKECNLEGSSNS